MKKIGIFNILFFSVLLLKGQASETDSLLNILKYADDRDKSEIYYNLSQTTIWSWPDSTIQFAEKGLEYANRFVQTRTKLNLLFSLSTALAEKGNFSMGLEYAFEKLAIAEEQKDPELLGKAKSNVGSIYYYAKDYHAALPYYLAVKEYSVEFERLKWLYVGFIGETYFHLEELDSAEKYIQISLDNLPSNYNWPPAYLYMGKIFEERGLLPKAVDYYKESMNGGVPIADYIKGYLALAKVFTITNKEDSAINYARKAYEFAGKTSFVLFTQEALHLLKENYLSLNMIDSAFHYQELLLAENDKLFSREKLVQLQNVTYEQEKRQAALLQEKEDQNRRIIIYSLIGGILIILVIVFILYQSNKFKQRAYNLLNKQKTELDFQKTTIEQTLSNLKSTQTQLIHSEKMASLGELTAGIAHEIQNPLNFVNNFSEVSSEMVDEMNEEIEEGNMEDVKEIASDLKQNLEKINHHGKRAGDIVKGMLQHSRTSSGVKELTDINALADEYLRLAFHGLRAKDKSFNASMKTDFDETIGTINIIPQDIGRVILNLITNAFYAVDERNKSGVEDYKPTVSVTTKKEGNTVLISVKDNGNGIPEQILDKIFQPFFTTKPTGQGTGLGLSLSYDIVKAHGGELKVETVEGEGIEFIIQLSI